MHSDRQPRILELLAADAMKRLDLKRGEELLNKAISHRPLMYHLYDRLVRLYGTQKRYDDIFRILNDKKTGFMQTNNQKAVKFFEARLKQAENRRTEAARKAKAARKA